MSYASNIPTYEHNIKYKYIIQCECYMILIIMFTIIYSTIARSIIHHSNSNCYINIFYI